MSHEDFMLSTRPKVSGSWNLHTLLPKGLDFFILLSSICGIFGAPGQANYASGNAYKDALARYRVTKGEKATSLDLGMMTAEGVLAENRDLLTHLKRAGFFMEISQAELFALLDHYCNPALDILTPLQCQVIVGIERPAVLHSLGMDAPDWMRRPLFRHFYQMNSKDTKSSGPSDKGPNYASLLRSAPSPADAAQVISQGLVRKTSGILAIPLEDIDATKPLHSFGVDSLIAVEVRNWLLKEIKADIAIFDILGNAAISDLSLTILGKSLYRK
ncbi:hypothetical protein MMC28_011642 [Mycoblastus sanguinarius]|nr:hypothetical protein [Mycoblastus sanguinarius]